MAVPYELAITSGDAETAERPFRMTRRYSSTDVGLIHIVGLDLNNLDAAQLAWLDTDLAAANANRAETPWIMVSSHFPLFHSATQVVMDTFWLDLHHICF